MDDGEFHYYTSEKRKRETFVKTVTASNFEQEVIKNEQIKSFLVMVYSESCPSCSINGPMFNIISRKLQRQGYDYELPCFRLNIENDIPYLG